MTTFRTVRGSCSCKTDFFSTPRTTTPFPLTPTFDRGFSFARGTIAKKSYGACAFLYGFEGVLDLHDALVDVHEVCVLWLHLKQVTVRREDSES